MGRKSQKELQQKLLIDNTELNEHFNGKFTELSDEQITELALSLYQFTKLIYDLIK